MNERKELLKLMALVVLICFNTSAFLERPGGLGVVRCDMLNNILKSLPNGVRVTTQVLAHFGEQRVDRIQQTDEDVFRVFLVDGVAQATIQTDGSVLIRELEAVG